jgi:hypothetical protein
VSVRITAVSAPVSTNGQLDNTATIDGTAEAQSVVHTGTITGGPPLVPGPIKRMPDADVISRYASKATTIPYSSSIEKVVIAPGYNPLGSTDPNGLYVINTGGSSLTIKNTRIHGTLVVRLGSGTLTLQNSILLHNYRSDFPTLLVEGNVILKCPSATALSEAGLSTNFNPSGAPYSGVSDTDKTDTYPNEIWGLVHISGSLTLEQTARVVGVVICDGPIYCNGNNTVTYTPSLYTSPPQWYTYVDGMKLSPGSWKQSVD